MGAQPDPGSVSSRDDFVAFVSAGDSADWASERAADYLESLAAWVEDTTHPLEPSWRAFATIIVAATVCE